MGKQINVISDIEGAVIKRLKSKWPKAAEFDIGKSFANMLAVPAVSVTTERVGMSMRSDLRGGCELLPVISVYTVFKAVQPQARREGVYPMVVAAAALLVGRDLGLDIAPFEPDGPIVEIFHEALSAGGMVAFKMQLKTSLELEISDDDTLERLLITANEYLYKKHEFETQTVELPNVTTAQGLGKEESKDESNGVQGLRVP